MTAREATGLDLVVERVQSKFPNFLLGLTIIILGALFASLIFQNKNKGAVSQTAAVISPTQAVQAMNANGEPFTILSPTTSVIPTYVPTPTATQKSLGEAVAQVFQPKPELSPTPIAVTSPTPSPLARPEVGKTYIVQSGDYLSAISQNVYGSTDHVADLAKSNNITDPNIVEIGQKLYIPMVTTPSSVPAPTTSVVAGQPTGTVDTSPSNQQAATAKVTITGSSYTIQSGDCLWNIAQAAYGDGYLWSKIAAANNLTTPDLIFAGNRITLPSR
jgi:nucleoid-associated protein YgaU